jgi:ADP-dependent NAD(P)H-hydrate dehydratase / NAD(P)H-hydrate epimerase
MTTTEALAAHTAEGIRGAEQRVSKTLAEDTLMQRAATGLARACGRALTRHQGGVYGRRVVLLVGTGNNGGDALLAGARLRRRGAVVHAVLTGDTAYRPGVSALLAAGGTVLDACAAEGRSRARELVAKAGLVVDGLVGLGGSAGLTEPGAGLVAAIGEGVPVLAVDLPSGVDPDTGEAGSSHVRADVTVTFGAYKPALLVPPAAYAAGRVEFVDVGLGPQLPDVPPIRRLTPSGAAARWPVPRREDHKYSRGVLGVVAGSDLYPGAAVLACAGAVRTGVGVVRYIGPARVTDHVLTARPEVVRGAGQVQAWLLGSGVEEDADQDTAIARAFESELPCVVDASALEAWVRHRLAGVRTAAADRVLLTPHAGELARMFGLLGHQVAREDIETRPLHHVRWAADEVGATVLLKGSITLVAGPDGVVSSQDDGPVWLATAGSGDVLAGIAGALMATGLDAMDAGSMAALIHGRAAARASDGGPVAAADVAAAVPATVAELLRISSR